MALRVVGAGLGRTGTASLQLALQQLLDGRCYHMGETFGRPDDIPVWHAAVKGTPPDFSGPRGVPFAADAADLCYVKDCARGIQLVQLAPKLPRRIYNIGGGQAISNQQLADAVRRAAPEAHSELQAGAGPLARPDFYMDLAAVTADVGYRPAYDIERGVVDYIGWLRIHPQ